MLAQTTKESTLSSGINTFTVPTKRKQNFDAEREKKNETNNSLNKSNKWSHNDSSPSLSSSSSSIVDQNNSLEMINNNIARLEALSPISSIEPWNTNVDNLAENSISKLQAITVSTTSDHHWQTSSNPSRTLRTAAELLNSEDDMDDDNYDDDDDDEQMSTDYGLRQQQQQQHQCLSQRSYYSSVHGYIKASLCSEPFLQQNGGSKHNFNSVAANKTTATTNFPWINSMSNGGGYNISPPIENSYTSHQTIKRAENGKSYLDLGSSSFNSSIDAKRPKKCCDGRGAWCNGGRNCYKEIRLRVRNISMFKLSRFRQVSEHSLYRSVLICNTLKHIEKEIDSDNRELCQKINSQFSLSQQTMNPTRISESTPNGRLELQQMSQHNPLNPVENKDFRVSNQKQSTVLPNMQSSYNNDFLHSYDNYPFNDSQFNGRVTPFPTTYCNTDIDSGYGDDDESNRSINWSSVLSLSSQSALDPLSNNDHYSTTTTPTQTTINPLSSDTSSAIGISNGFSTSSSPVTASSGGGTLNNQVSSPSSLSSSSLSTTLSPEQSSSTPVTTTTTLEYGFFDMDLGLGHNITELLPNYKLSSNDILKSISSSISPKFCHESNLESPARIMVGS